MIHILIAGILLFMNQIYNKFDLDIRFTWFELDKYRSIKPFLTQLNGSVVTSYWDGNVWVLVK